MALTAIEQLKIIAGETGPQEADLMDVVKQTGVINGVNFIINLKDTSGDALADSYKEKYLRVVYRLFNQNIDTAQSIRRILIVILGSNSFTYAQIEAASDAQWMTFIADNIDESIEYLAQIIPEEKSAYSNL